MDLASIFIHDTTWAFFAEIVLRCLVMYILIILFLRMAGKRGIRQLSIFEVAIILSLGSIAGDPMFDEEIPLLQAFIVISTVLLLYRMTTWCMMKYQPFEDLMEGKSLYIIEDGLLVVEDLKKENLSHDEFFGQMRQQSVEHLGQVRTALLESDGALSVLFFEPEQVKYGLPLFPKACQIVQDIIPHTHYSCVHCGYTDLIQHPKHICPRCEYNEWSESINTQRLG